MKLLKNKFFIGALICSLLALCFSLFSLGFHSIQLNIDGKPLANEEISYFFKAENISATHLDKDGKILIPWSLLENRRTLFFSVKEKTYFFKTPKYGSIEYNLNTKTNVSTTTYIYDFGFFKFFRSKSNTNIQPVVPKL